MVAEGCVEPSKLERGREVPEACEGAGELEPDRTYCRASSRKPEAVDEGPGSDVFRSPLDLPGDDDDMITKGV